MKPRRVGLVKSLHSVIVSFMIRYDMSGQMTIQEWRQFIQGVWQHPVQYMSVRYVVKSYSKGILGLDNRRVVWVSEATEV